MHAGLKANFLFRRRDPILGPALHSFSAQKAHFLDQSLLNRVSLHEVSLRILHRPYDRSHSLAKLRMATKKGQKGFVA